jgi:Tfp pilus assembly protein PilO
MDVNNLNLNDVMRKVRENFLSILIVGICVMIAFKTFTRKQGEMDALKQADDLEHKKNAVLLEISELEKNFQSQKAKINNKEINKIFYLLSTMAKSADVKIINIKPASEQALPVYTRYPYELSIAVSSYHALGRFVSKLESAPEVYFIEKMDITMNGGQIVVNMLVSTVLIQ